MTVSAHSINATRTTRQDRRDRVHCSREPDKYSFHRALCMSLSVPVQTITDSVDVVTVVYTVVIIVQLSLAMKIIYRRRHRLIQ